MLRSTDHGATWAPATSGLPDLNVVLGLIPDAVRPNTMYAATWGAGIYRTTDAGASWVPMNQGLFDRTVTGLAMDPTGHRFYASASCGAIYRMDLG